MKVSLPTNKHRKDAQSELYLVGKDSLFYSFPFLPLISPAILSPSIPSLIFTSILFSLNNTLNLFWGKFTILYEAF